jgi:hypothetical protein
MSLHHNRSVTLIELLLAISLMWLLILATSNIDMFSRGYLLGADRRSKLQNELYLVAEDICKNVAQAPGDLSSRAVTVSGTTVTVRTAISHIDYEYDSANFKITKDTVPINNRGVIVTFEPQELDNGIGISLNINGTYDPPPQIVSVNNPEVNITTRCYSHQASAR